MRSFTLIGLIGVLLASASIAQAHNTRWAWTESKAAKMVASNTTSGSPLRRHRWPPAQRRRAVVRRCCLRRAAGGRQEGAGDVPGCLARYDRARDQVRNGLGIAAAACKGSGAAMQGKRFKHFRRR